jgi:hypothetical protein
MTYFGVEKAVIDMAMDMLGSIKCEKCLDRPILFS